MSVRHNIFCFHKPRTIELVVALVPILYVVSSITGNSVKLSMQIAKSVAPAIGIVGGDRSR